MTQDEIIQMAKKAGLEQDGDNFFSPSREEIDVHITYLTRFAALVLASKSPQSSMAWQEGFEAGKQTEREACAKVCEGLRLEWEDQPSIAQAERATMMDCANAIRARGNK